jgi:hypothetical protein
MSSQVQAKFETRRDAELALEHLVQEHSVDRANITLRASGDANSAGRRAAGADVESGQPGLEKKGEPKLSGYVEVHASCTSSEIQTEKAALRHSKAQNIRET